MDLGENQGKHKINMPGLNGMTRMVKNLLPIVCLRTGLGSVKLAWALLFALLSGYTATIYAGPTGGNIVGGTGSIQQSNLTTNIRQNTQSMVINWNSYNLKPNEVINYLQPGASSIALNRILSNSPS